MSGGGTAGRNEVEEPATPACHRRGRA